MKKIVCGKAGTSKTTFIKNILKNFQIQKLLFLLKIVLKNMEMKLDILLEML